MKGPNEQETRFLPLAMGQKEAFAELESAGKEKAAAYDTVNQITNLLLQNNLTPLQAQAVLVRAWRNVQLNGRLNLPRQGLCNMVE